MPCRANTQDLSVATDTEIFLPGARLETIVFGRVPPDGVASNSVSATARELVTTTMTDGVTFLLGFLCRFAIGATGGGALATGALAAGRSRQTVEPRHHEHVAGVDADLLNIVATIAEKRVGFRSLGDTWPDTTAAHGRLMGAVLGGLAEFDPHPHGRGRARAVANGIRLGRKPTLTAHQRREAINLVNAEKDTLGEIARSYNVSRWTISRLSP
jgi:hypothetical protein